MKPGREGRLTRAIVRPPGASFARGLTTANLGSPDVALALDQHDRYCRALEQCGLSLTRLQPDERHPDSTFVEDTAVVTARGAVVTRPGAPTRRGEVAEVRDALAAFCPAIFEIRAPGTLDGGDVCEAGGRFFIGLSKRTTEAGARQLADRLSSLGHSSSLVDIRGIEGLLHLKSGLAFLGEGRLAVVDSLTDQSCFSDYEAIRVHAQEMYAANCVRINDRILVASGFPVFEDALRDLGLDVIPLEMSEFRKMDGGLSCLSIRF